MLEHLPSAPEVMNPVQYLGSKVRILPDILSAYGAQGREGVVLDLFSGSSVVSQALSHRAPVIGVDDGRAAGVLFDGMVQRWSPKDFGFEETVPTAREREESRLIKKGDATGLVALYRLHRAEFDASYQPGRSWWAKGTDAGRTWVQALYGGHFFGFRQARELDALRVAIHSNGLVGSDLHVALLGTASRTVASAGKHFASPLNFLNEDVRPSPFVLRRLMEDRDRDVVSTFARILTAIRSIAPGSFGRASSFQRMDLSRALPTVSDVGFVYADPPYTTEQYSRYYHVLDRLALDRPFDLSMRAGRPVLGRYPENRAVSDFCAPGRALGAFEKLYDRVRSLDAPFAFSYSSPTRDGARARTVPMDRLEELLRARFRSVRTLRDPEHRYRPLQPADRMKTSASELLVVAVP